MKKISRRLQDVFQLCHQKTSSRRLDQGEYVRFSHTSSEDIFNMSWSRPIHSSWSYVFKTSSRRFNDVFKTFLRRLQDILQKCLQDIFKTSSRRFKDDFKTSSRRLTNTSLRYLQDVLQRCLQDIFKTYHQAKLFVSTRLRDVFSMFSDFLRRTARTGCLQKDLPRSHFSEIYGQCTEFARVIKICQVLVFHWTTSFSGRTSTKEFFLRFFNTTNTYKIYKIFEIYKNWTLHIK